MKDTDWGDVVSVILIVALFLVLAFTLLFLVVDANRRNASVNLCVRSGYVSSIQFADTYYCYRLSGEQGELVSVDSLRKEAK